MITEKKWIRLGFTYPALSPVAWTAAFILGGIFLFWGSLQLVFESVPHWLIWGLMLVAFGLSRQIEKQIYPVLAPLYGGGWMPSLQKTWMSLALFALLGLAGYLFWWNMILGILFFVAIVGYSWRYLPRANRKHNPLQAFSELVNSDQRIESPGIRTVEKVCIWACLTWFLVGSCALLDLSLTLSHPSYSVRILGTEIHRGSKGAISYRADLAGWRRPRRKIKQQITYSQYQQLVPGRTYLMQTRRSLFGTERLESIQLAPSSSNPQAQ